MLSLFNRPHQRIPQLFRADVLKSEFRCHECGSVLIDRGYWNGANGERIPQYRCIAPGCAQSTFKPINPARTTFAACGLI